MEILVKKADGRKEAFDSKKIVDTCIRAGLSRRAAEGVLKKVLPTLYDGIRTHDIYRMVLMELERKEDKSSLLFRLREAVSQMPADQFEIYVKKILESSGYKCKWNTLIEGKFVEHQIDIIAEKAGRKYLVECKHHINPHRFCGLGIVLQVQARLDDIKEGFKERKNSFDFYKAWVITNTKFSEHAKAYAEGKSMMLSGWKYKSNISMENMIQEKRLYPISILISDKAAKKKMFDGGILTIQDMMPADISWMDKKTADYVKNQAKILLR